MNTNKIDRAAVNASFEALKNLGIVKRIDVADKAEREAKREAKKAEQALHRSQELDRLYAAVESGNRIDGKGNPVKLTVRKRLMAAVQLFKLGGVIPTTFKRSADWARAEEALRQLATAERINPDEFVAAMGIEPAVPVELPVAVEPESVAAKAETKIVKRVRAKKSA